MKSKALFLVALLLLGGVLWQGLVGIHPFGDPGPSPMDQHFLEKAQPEKAANNVVTAIVFDYRGFDTLGEGAVLFTAICSVAALFRQGGHGK